MNAWTREKGTSVLPWVRGIRSLISATTKPGVLRGGQCGIDRRAERAVAVGVRRRQLQQRHIERDQAFGEKRGDVRQEDRDEVRVAAFDGVAHGGPAKSDTD